MAVAQRIESLQARHAGLEQQLTQEEARSWHNESKIVRLKQDKLRLKDEIRRLRLIAGGAGPPEGDRVDSG